MESEQSIFAAALEQSPAERAAYLAAACGSDDSLRARVERLLAADQRAAGILDRGVAPSPFDAPLAAERVFAGRFKLREKIGEGGMGEVWVADQIEPVQRRVALKAVRTGHDSTKMLARFEQERQALALMDHPNIAKVLDAGVDELSRPYFVMELIKGVAITDFCDSAKMSLRERIELFLPVCHAVQHAHQKGIIHRDLKPSNILVGLYDDRAVAKVIDFGVAKATGARLIDASIYTEIGSLIGTLEYMSPEQAEPNNIDIDTRSDIYSLGAMLCELLTGSVPFSRKDLQSAAFAEMLRIIKEVEPPKPSTKLSGSGTLPAVAAVRQMEPKKLVAIMRGELDWIILKCLEKSRLRRYETANGLAMDLQRFLANEPVSAGPPSARYRLRKFVRRNRVPVLATSIVVLALIGGVIGTSIGLLEARRQRDAATAAERLASQRLVEADNERAIAQATSDFLLKDLLEQAYVGNQQFGAAPSTINPKITVREVLDRADKVIEGKFAGQPLVEAAVRLTLSDTYRRLGEYGPAIAHAQRAVDLRHGQFAEDHADVLDAEKRLAQAYSLNSRHPDAIRLLEKVRDLSERSRGPDDLATLDAIQSLAYVLMRSGRSDDAATLLERVYAARLKVQSFEQPDCLDAAVHLARLKRNSSKVNEAIALLERVRDVHLQRRDPDDPETVFALETLAMCYSKVGRTREAVAVLQRVRDSRVRVLESDHPATLHAIGNLANAYRDDGQIGEAIPLYERVAEAQKRKLPPGHISTLITLSSLARAYQKADRLAECVQTHEQLTSITENRYGPDHGQTLARYMHLGQAFETAGNLERAIVAYRRAAEGVERAKLDLEFRLDYTALLCRAYEKQKQFDLAGPLWRQSLDLAKSAAGAQSKEFAAAQANLGRNLILQGKWVDAEALLRAALVVLEANQADDWLTFSGRSILGESLLGQKKYSEAEGLLLKSYEGLVQREAKIPPHEKARLIEAVERLAQLYDTWSKPAEAAKWAKEIQALKSRLAGKGAGS